MLGQCSTRLLISRYEWAAQPTTPLERSATMYGRSISWISMLSEVASGARFNRNATSHWRLES